MIVELPKMSLHDRRFLCEKILELEEDSAAMRFAIETPDLAFQELDKMKEEDQGDPSR